MDAAHALCLILFICLLYALYFRESSIKQIIFSANKHVQNTINGKKYLYADDSRNYYILGDKPNQQKALDLIKNVNKFMIDFIIELKKKYLYDEKMCPSEPTFNPEDEFVPFSASCSIKNPLDDYKFRAIYLLVTRYRPNSLEENQPTSERDTSWEEGKGDRIALCLREQESGQFKFLDIELIKFVAIHELTHIAANTLQHPYYFWKVFKFLLHETHTLMGFKIIDYSVEPVNYCGLKVTYNPFMDFTIDISKNDSRDIVTID